LFAYLDPTIRKKLLADGTLIRVDARGRLIPEDKRHKGEDITINILGPIPIPLDIDNKEVMFSWYPFVRHTELDKAEEIAAQLRTQADQNLFALLSSHMSVNSALVWGEMRTAKNPLIRVHSSCLTGDVFGSKRCECGPQLLAATHRIYANESGGAVIYMSGHEGRGIGLWAKAVTYLLQDGGQNTYQANRTLGLPDDSRDFSDAATMLLYLMGGDRPFKLLSNNPKKLDDLHERGLSKITPIKHVTGINKWNARYLQAKREWGHTLDMNEITDDYTSS